MRLVYTRVGSGEPLVLLHGLGGFGRHWEPLVPALSAAYDVIAPDLPGFGASPPLPGDAAPPSALAAAVAELLDELGIETAHVVGHSLGGHVGFELAAARGARSVFGLSPGGLWVDHQSRLSTTMLRATYLVASTTRPVVGPFVLAGSRISPARFRAGAPRDLAVAAYEAYATSPGYLPALRGAEASPFTRGEELTMPVTVAFGTRDFVILPRDRVRDRLPAHTRWVDLPGLGHSPQWQHPDVVVRTIVDATRSPAHDGGTHG